MSLAGLGRKITLFRKRQEDFQGYYRIQDSFCICGDGNVLMEILGFPHSTEK